MPKLDDFTNEDLLAAWRTGNERAASVLVHRYMVRMTALARGKLSRRLAQRIDPEDIVLSAWRSFFVAMDQYKLKVPESDDLWPILAVMTTRKLSRQVQRQQAQKRDLRAESLSDISNDWPGIVSRDPSPEEAAMLVDEVEKLLSTLPNNEREMITRRLSGEAPATIAEELNCSERTVRRTLKRVRDQLHFAENEDRQCDLELPENVVPILESLTNHPSEKHREPVTLDFAPTIEYSELTLEKMLAQGTFGKVFLSRWAEHDELVAVKFLKKALWENADCVRMMINETVRVASLSHPNTIRHFGWGQSPHGAIFLVMEYVDGITAQQWTSAAKPSIKQILKMAVPIARALAQANGIGIIHGDITPANVLVRADEEAVLTDFGLSMVIGNPEWNYVAGTPGFLAPEQISDAFGEIGPRTDVYGFGCLLHALITGQPPIQGIDLPEILAKTLSAKPVPSLSSITTEIPASVDQFVRACLSKEPSQRPGTMEQVANRLSELISQHITD